MHRPVARQVPSAASADRSALSRGQKALLRLQQSKQHTSAAAGHAINTPQATQLSSTHRKPVQQQAVHQQQQQQQQRQQHVSSRYTTQVLTGSCESVQGYCQQQQQSQLYASQPRLLTAAIKRCRCWQQIQQLLELAAAAVNHIHIVAAIVHSAQVNDRHAQQQHQQQQQQQRAIKQDYGSGKHQQQYQSTKQQQQQQQLPAASAAYKSWLLHQTQHLLKQHNSELELRHTSNLLWALAKSRSHAAAETHSSSSSSSSGSSGGYANVVHQLLRLQEQQLVGISSHGVQQQQQQQRCLEDQPVPGFSNPPSHQPLKPQDLSNSIWALATMQHQPPESWLQLFWTLSQQCLSNCTMQELSNTIWAVAKLRLLPEQQWIMAFDDAFMAALQQQQHQCTEINNSGTSSGNRSAVSQAYANIAYALGSLYKQQQQQQQLWQVQSDWVVRYCQATQPLLQDCTAGQLSMMLWGLTAWDSSSSSSASDNAEQQQQQQQQGLLLSGLWLEKFAAAMQQQLHAFTDQGLVNIAASSYKLLLLSQQQQQQHELQDGVHDRVDSEQQQQHHQQQQHQLRELLRLALQAAPSRLQTMQPTAAAALVWASAGLSSSSSSSGSSSIRFDQSSSSSAAAADASLPPSCASFMKQYIESHTAAAAAGSSSTDTVQLLWLCAKARQLPSSVAWCQNMSHKLQQQQQLSTGQVAQVMWSLGQLLLLCCQQQQQQQRRQQVASSVQDNSTSSSSDSNSSSTGAIVSMLQELSLSVIEDGIKILDDMDPLQLVEFAAAAAHITAALPHLMSKQQQQQQQQQAAAAAVPALMTAATTLLHQQQQCREHKLQQQHMLTLLESLHTLLHHVYTAAASSSSSSSTMHKVLDKFLAAAATQIAGSSTYLTVRLALLLLSIAQIPARQAAAAASNRSMQTPIPTAAAAAGRCNAVTDESSSGLTVSGCTCSPWIQQALCDVLSAEWVQLDPDQLLSAAWLCYRNSIQLSADALSDLLYTLRSNISTRSTTTSSSSSNYTPQQQLLFLLLLSRQWRRVPAAAERAKTALIERLLMSSQRYMYAEAIEQQQQQCIIQTAAAGSSNGSVDQLDGRYLSQLLYGLAQAHISPPEPWMLLYQQSLLLHIPAMTLLQITKVLLGLAKLGFRPQAAVAASLLNRSQQLLPTADRSHLVCIIHALGRLHLIPSDDWLQQFYARALDAPGYFKVSGFGMVVWGLAKVGARPSQQWMQQLVDSTFTEQQQQQVHPVTEGSLVRSKLKPQHLANMVCGFAKLGFVPDAGWMSWFRAQVGQQSGALQELDHFHIEWAWRELNEQQMRE